jgi:hypothetical protein
MEQDLVLPQNLRAELLDLHEHLAALTPEQTTQVYWTLRLLRQTYTAENAALAGINERLARVVIAEWLAGQGHDDVDVDQAVTMWEADIARALIEETAGNDG